MPIDILVPGTGGSSDITVNGKTTIPEKVTTHHFQCLPNKGVKVRLEAVAGTVIRREHSPNIHELSLTVHAPELFTDDYKTLSYGANPRLPVLCKTFDSIFETASTSKEDFILRNSGIDIFCKLVTYDSERNRIDIEFDSDSHGIANGGLTTSVLRYIVEKGLADDEMIPVSVRIWAVNADEGLIDEATTARNSHRELELADRLNRLGAFDHIKQQLPQEIRAKYAFHVGDVEADEGAKNAVTICRLLYGFTLSPNEAHPTRNHLPPGGAQHSFKPAGRMTRKGTGINLMKKTVGLE